MNRNNFVPAAREAKAIKLGALRHLKGMAQVGKTKTKIYNGRRVKTMNRGVVYFTERNIRGAWVIWGAIGMRQYYNYAKKDAEQMYRQEAKQKWIIAQ